METTIRKNRNGWQANTYVKSDKGGDWWFCIRTWKTGRGLSTNAQEEQIKDGIETFVTFSDEYRTWRFAHDGIKTVTEKVCMNAHTIGLAEFFKAFPLLQTIPA